MTASHLLIDVALAIAAVELVVLLVRRRRAGHGDEVGPLLANLGAGLCLMLAVRTALVGAAWPWLAACLAGAGVAHVADLALRRRHG